MLHAYVTNLAPGLHTMTLEYKVAAGTAYFGAGTIARRLSVQARPPSRPSQAAPLPPNLTCKLLVATTFSPHVEPRTALTHLT